MNTRELTVTTDEVGGYRFDDVPAGTAELTFRLLNFSVLRRTVTVASGTAVTVDAVLTLSLSADVIVTGTRTFRNVADVENPAANLVGIAASASQGAVTAAHFGTLCTNERRHAIRALARVSGHRFGTAVRRRCPRARFTDDDPAGTRIPGALDRVISAGLTFEPQQRLFGSIRVRHFGPRPLVEDASVNSKSTTLWNGEIGYRLSNKARLVLEAFNLFDAEVSDVDYFYASRLPGEPAGGVHDVHFHPALPRSVRAGIQFAF